jgi:hypothetical protein
MILSWELTSSEQFKDRKSISTRQTAASDQTGTEGWLQQQGEYIVSETSPCLFIHMCSRCWLIKPTFWNVKFRWFQQLATVRLVASHGTDGGQDGVYQSQSKIFTLNITKHPIMAATPEELLGLIEPAPPSPSIFLDHPSMTHDGSEPPQDDQTLAYISRMLMEEDIVDKFFYQYPDHSKLLQAEQPFAQILSGAATNSSNAQESSAPNAIASTMLHSKGRNTDIMVSRFFSGEVQDPTFFVNGTCVVEPNSMVFPSEGSASIDMVSSIAFFKGIEEANMFLPRDNGVADDRGRKHRFDMSDETEADLGRRSKQIVVLVHTDAEEEATALEKLDRLILNGYDMYPNEMQEVVRLTLDKENKAAELSIYRRGRRGVRQTAVTDLETLLIRCAEAVASNDQRSGRDLLERIKWHSSPTGDARQRLAHYFAQALEARMAGTGSQLYGALMGKRTSVVELIKGYHLYMAACCSLKVSLLFSNKTIYTSVAGRRKLHIVHYGINTGFQWPELLRWLADREGGPPEVRITGIFFSIRDAFITFISNYIQLLHNQDAHSRLYCLRFENDKNKN